MSGVAREVAELCLFRSVGSKVEQACARSDLYRRRRRLTEAWIAYVTGGGSDWEGNSRCPESRVLAALRPPQPLLSPALRFEELRI